MERRDFIKTLGIAIGASAIPITTIASSIDNNVISDDVLKEKIQVFFYHRYPYDDIESRYYLTKQEAYFEYLMNRGGGGDVMTSIQNIAYISKFCLPEYGGKSKDMYQEYSADDILTKEVTIDDFIKWNNVVKPVVDLNQPLVRKA